MVIGQEGVRCAVFARIGVLMFDQEPIGAFAAATVMLHADEDPTALQALAGENEFEIPFFERRFRCFAIQGFPITAIPELDGTAAILALRYRAFEIAIVQRVILDLDSEAFIGGIERGAARYGPGFEDTVQLQAQVVMQSPRSVFLDDKAPPRGRRQPPPPRSAPRSV